MKPRSMLVALVLVVSGATLFAMGSAAEGSSSNRGTYLSRAGYIIHPDEIQIEHYIAQRDFDYPLPGSGDLNVITGAAITPERAYILLGLKGRQVPFEKLPPLNISFCIDRSGSMTGMIPWVKDCFYIFIDRVRDGDIVSLVDMNDTAQTLISPTRILGAADRTQFKRQVDRIAATGSTNVYAGMQQSYREVESNYDPRYVNRVVILTDGMHNFGEMTDRSILELAARYKDKGINISTVLLGIQAATGLMVDVAIEGGGSARFISDHDEMVKIFQTELDRMLVPAARELRMRLQLAEGVELQDTWGYRHNVKGSAIEYYLPTLHNGDYETMFAEVTVAHGAMGSAIGSFSLSYLDLANVPRTLGPFPIKATAPAVGNLIGDARVREAEGYLQLARGLIEIGNNTQRIIDLEQAVLDDAVSAQQGETGPQQETDDDVDSSQRRARSLDQLKVELNRNLELVGKLADYLSTVSTSLGGGRYEKELEILSNYKNTFTKSLEIYSADEGSSKEE